MDKEKMWKELIEIEKQRKNETIKMENEITTKEFAEWIGLSVKQAKTRLDILESEGKVSSRLINLSGHITRVYSLFQ